MKYLWETNKELINKLQRESKSFHSHIHGFKHWRTVEKNGLYLALFTVVAVELEHGAEASCALRGTVRDSKG